MWSLAATSHGFLPGPPLTSQQSSQLIIRLWFQRTVEQLVWNGGIPRLWCLEAAVTFILLGKVREVDRDPAPPTGPATLFWGSWCLTRSPWLTIPKVALSGGDSDLYQPVSPWASEQAKLGVLPLGISAQAPACILGEQMVGTQSWESLLVVGTGIPQCPEKRSMLPGKSPPERPRPQSTVSLHFH